MEGRTLAETRRAAQRFLLAVLSGAFPDRPPIEPAGAREVLAFAVHVRRQASRRPPRLRDAA